MEVGVPRRETAGSLMSGGRFLVKDVNVSILGFQAGDKVWMCGGGEAIREGVFFDVAKFMRAVCFTSLIYVY